MGINWEEPKQPVRAQRRKSISLRASDTFDVVAHWRRVLATVGLPDSTYDAARACLKQLGHEPVAERQPGEDDDWGEPE